MTKLPKLSAEYVREVLDYDPLTGEFRWKSRTGVPSYWNPKFAGKVAGTIVGSGYRMIMIDLARYQASNLAWVWMTGEWPAEQIDHRNRESADDRWENLRLATECQNATNKNLYKNNTSGYRGVSWNERQKKYGAAIQQNKKSRHIGWFATRLEAARAYDAVARRLHGEFARLNFP